MNLRNKCRKTFVVNYFNAALSDPFNQLTKYQMCIGCKACESVCKHSAIKIKEMEDGSISYKIDDQKCKRCTECVNHFNAGCYVRKVLTIKREG